MFEKVLTLKKNPGFLRYFGNTSWMFLAQMLRMLTSLLVGLWVARYLGPEQFGVFNYVIAFTAIFTVLSGLGLDGILVRELVNFPQKKEVLLGTAFWLKLLGAVFATGVMGLVILASTNNPVVNIYIFIVAGGIFFQSFTIIDLYFQSEVRSKFVSICSMLQLFVSSLLKIYFVFTGADLFWFVVVVLVDQVTFAVSLFIAYRLQNQKAFYRYFDFSVAKRLIKNSWPLILSSMVVTIYMKIDQVMIKEMLGEYEVGVYSAAVRLSEVWYFIPMIISTSLFPAILNAKKVSKELYNNRIQRLYTFVFWMAFGICVPMTFLSDWIVSFLYGSAYMEAGQVLSIHIWAGVFVFLGVVSGKFYLSENMQIYTTINTAVGAIVNVALNYILLPIYGVIGAAFATLISYAVAAYLMNVIFRATRDNFRRLTYSVNLLNLKK